MTGLITLPHSSSSDSLIKNDNCLISKKKNRVNVTNIDKTCEKEQEKVNENKSEGKIYNNDKEMNKKEKKGQRDDEEKDREEEEEGGGGEEFITEDELRQMTPWSYQVGRSLCHLVGHLAITLQSYFYYYCIFPIVSFLRRAFLMHYTVLYCTVPYCTVFCIQLNTSL